jgi:hypothetical protein
LGPRASLAASVFGAMTVNASSAGRMTPLRQMQKQFFFIVLSLAAM